jgi:hypothetical protein
VIRLNQLLADNQFRTITTGPFAGIELTAETAAQAEKFARQACAHGMLA